MCPQGGWKEPRDSELGVTPAELLANAAWMSPAQPSVSRKCCRNLENLHGSGKLFPEEPCLCQGLTSTSSHVAEHQGAFFLLWVLPTPLLMKLFMSSKGIENRWDFGGNFCRD